ncbi:MAG TPA: MATE family efflux transporter, partial [Kofleriaceae bacterium]|nr:MATE family efflux transporter [Kofleriaceae bacterium]
MSRPTRQDLREQWTLAVPLALGHMAQHAMQLVDTALLGRYSEPALAGASIGGGMLFTVMVLGMGIILGMDALVPQAIGAGEHARARRILWQGLRLAVIVGLPLMAVAAATTLLLPLMGVQSEVAAEARAFIFGRMPSMVPFLLFASMRSYLQARGVTRPVVVAAIIGNIVNGLADWILIFGDGGLHDFGLPGIGLPPLGALGAALATSTVTCISVLYLALAVRALEVPGAPSRAELRARDPEVMRRIVRVGLPIGLHLMAEVGVFALTAMLAGRMGKTPGAAHGIAITWASMTFSVVIGLGAATAVRVGRAVGAADVPGTRRAGVTGLYFGLIFMSGAAILMLAIPEQLAGAFTSDPDLIAAAVPLLRIAAVFQLS